MRTTFRTAFLSLLTTSAGLAACAVDTRSIERPVIGGAPKLGVNVGGDFASSDRD